MKLPSEISNRLNENFKGSGGGAKPRTLGPRPAATRSRSAVREAGRTAATFRSSSATRGPPRRDIKDAHERFRDRIINGRDINDVEEELNTERAKNVQMETVIKMKESQIVKYSKGLEKAKGILKGMVESTQQKMGKLQEKVDSLQSTLQQRESQLLEKNREIESLTGSAKDSGYSFESLRSENEKMKRELESYRDRSKNATDRFEGRQSEWHAKQQDLSSSNHRLTTELARVNAQLQRRIRDDQEKTAEIERLQMRLLELEGGSFSDNTARNLSLARARAEMEQMESSLAGLHAMMQDVEFFVSIKNELDEFETASSTVPETQAEKENIIVPPLKSMETFEKLLETTDVPVLMEVHQRLNREIESDRVNCRRSLKELQSQAYILNHGYNDLNSSLEGSTAETTMVLDAFGDIEVALESFNQQLKEVEIYGDVRDQSDNNFDVNKLLAGFREEDDKERVNVGLFTSNSFGS